MKDIIPGGKPQSVCFKVTWDQDKTIVKLIGHGAKIARVVWIVGLSQPTVYRVLRNQKTCLPPERV